jgi:hypothetical protein
MMAALLPWISVPVLAATDINLAGFNFGQDVGTADIDPWWYTTSNRTFSIRDDVTITGTTTPNGNVTFNVSSGVTVEYSASITAAANRIIINGGGTFNMISGTITGTLPTSNGLITVSGANTTVNINGGTVSLTAANGMAGAMPAILLENNTRVTLGGTGSITLNTGAVAGANAIRAPSTSTGSVITVSGGSITAPGASTAIQTGGAALNISGGIISAPGTGTTAWNGTVVVNSETVAGGGDVVISGGTIEATAANGRAINISEGQPRTVTVSSGIVRATENNGVAINSMGSGNRTINIIGGTITGGGGTGAAIRNAGSGTFSVRYGVSVTGVTDGSAAGGATVNIGGTNHTVAAENTAITVNAGTPPAGQMFSHWTAVPSVVFSPDAQTATASFPMPASIVSVTANWVNLPAPTAAQFTHNLTDVRTFNNSQQGVTVTPAAGMGAVTVYYTGTSGTTYGPYTTPPANARTY